MAITVETEIIQNAIQFWNKLRSDDKCKVKFQKKDGTIRFMICTLNFQLIPPIHHPKKMNISKSLKLMQNNDIIHVYDIEKEGWRSITFTRVEYIEVGKKRYMVQLIKRMGGK